MTDLARLFATSMRLHHDLQTYARAHSELKLGKAIERADMLARELGVEWAKEPD